MKILLLCYENINGENGGMRQVIELAKKLQSNGHEVRICVPKIEVCPNPPVPVYYIPVINLPKLRYLIYLLLSPIFLTRILFSFKPDRILYFMIHYNITALLSFITFRIPYVLFINGIVEQERLLNNFPFEKLFFWLMDIIFNKTILSARALIVVTTGLKNYLINQYRVPAEKIHIVRAGVDTTIFYPLDTHRVRDRLKFKNADFIIGFHGGFFPWHGLDYLVSAAPFILQELPRTICVLVGSGSMVQPLQEMIREKHLEDHFIFTGSVPMDSIPLYVNCFDIGIIFFKPVRTDPGEPLKMYEYMACGIPVAASDVAGYGDFVEEMGAGIRVQADDPQKLAESIVALLRDKNRREQMGKAGREKTTALHSWNQRAKQIETIFNLL